MNARSTLSRVLITIGALWLGVCLVALFFTLTQPVPSGPNSIPTRAEVRGALFVVGILTVLGILILLQGIATSTSRRTADLVSTLAPPSRSKLRGLAALLGVLIGYAIGYLIGAVLSYYLIPGNEPNNIVGAFSIAAAVCGLLLGLLIERA